ncbi:MAG TPA: hypothetical protein VIV60_26860 [Polyangiaceae bacterium]
MNCSEAAKQFQLLMLRNGAMLEPLDPNLYGNEDRNVFKDGLKA